MNTNRNVVFGVATLGVFLLILAGLFVVGRYERGRRSERFSEAQDRVHALADAVGDLEVVRRLQVVHKFRAQPLDSVARRRVREITGKRELFGTDSVAVFLSMAIDGLDFWQDIPCISVQHGRNKEFCGVASADSLATPRQIRESEALRKRQSEIAGEEFESLLARDQEIFHMTGAVKQIESGFAATLFMVPPTVAQASIEVDANRKDWFLATEAAHGGHAKAGADEAAAAFEDFKAAWKERKADRVEEAAKRLDASCRALDEGNSMQVDEEIAAELTFNRAEPFNRASMLFFGCAALSLFGLAFRVRWGRGLGIALGIIGVALMIWGFYLRTTLGFGVAIHNLYESMVAVALVSMLLCLTLQFWAKARWAVPSGALAAFVVLQIVDVFSVKYDDAIGAPIAVLANNFWIHIHVPVVMTAYAAYFIAFILSAVALPWVLFRDRRATTPELKELLHTGGIAVNIGTPLMLMGLVLGGIWANESWGRFWGWDPKETWALILFLYFLIPIHGRFTKWLSPFWNAWTMFFGGLVLLWTYYGTNEFLVGLHSYAGEGQIGSWYDKLFHENNLWFTASSGVIAAISLLSAILHLVTNPRAASDGKGDLEPSLDSAAADGAGR